jgi:hypothetical protein
MNDDKKEELVGTKVKLVLVDPWDFVTVNGPGPFTATILKTSQGQDDNDVAVLLQVEPILQYDGMECKYFVGSPRHENKSIREILSSKLVACNLTRVPEERATSADAFDLSWWRGGIALIADLSI